MLVCQLIWISQMLALIVHASPVADIFGTQQLEN